MNKAGWAGLLRFCLLGISYQCTSVHYYEVPWFSVEGRCLLRAKNDSSLYVLTKP